MGKYSMRLLKDVYVCQICPNNCELREGQVGKCSVRGVKDGEVKLLTYGQVSTVAVEPIEKKPFYHFMPGTKVLSLGSRGCSFRCSYCQNYSISQSPDVALSHFSLEQAVASAIEKKCKGICFTYNEPIPSYEYIIDLARAAHDAGLYFVLSTNGFAEKDVWSEICEVSDAINIDYKGNSSKQYEEVARNKFFPYYHVITRLMEAITQGKTHIEISVPVLWEATVKQFDDFREFVHYYNKFVPIHLLRVVPSNEMMHAPATPESLLMELREYLMEKLPFVYVGNIFTDEAVKTRHTYCSFCGQVIVERKGFETVLKLNADCGRCASFLRLS